MMCIETHVLLQVVRGDVVAPHHAKIAFAIAHDDVGLAFDQNSEPVRSSMPDARRGGEATLETTPPPIVAKNAAEPLIARESTEARITSKTASNGVLCESERLCPSRTMASVGKKDDDAAQRRFEQTSSLSVPRLSRAGFQKNSRSAFIAKIVSPQKAWSSACRS